MIALRRSAMIALALIAASCTRTTVSVTGSPAPMPNAIDEAETKWYGAHVGDYTWTMNVGCFCGVAGDYTVRVRAGAPTGIRRDGHREPILDAVRSGSPLEVADLFTLIRSNAALGADKIDVTYGPELGFPADIAIDFDAGGDRRRTPDRGHLLQPHPRLSGRSSGLHRDRGDHGLSSG